MHKSIVLGSIAALSFAGQALAADESFSYSYLEANYVSANVDNVSRNPDGFGVNGSIAFTPMIHGYLEYTNLNFDGITLEGWEVGAGLNHTLNPMIDLIGRVAYVKADVEGPGDDDGFALQAGVRGRPAANFELEGLVHYVDLSDAGSNTSLRVDGRYFFLPQFAVGAGVEYDNDQTVWNVGVRWNFNTNK